ncbi:MAG: ECF-type sigma factor, partial [Pirellulaceae bacterium]
MTNSLRLLSTLWHNPRTRNQRRCQMVDGWDQELYQQLRSVARRFMGRESANHTLTPTDLFHEAFARVQPRLLSPAIGV